MSKYTTEVRYICETLSGLKESVGGNSLDEVISKSISKIFDNFPIFDERYRKELETKIIKHYYFREIGFETYGMWKIKLNTKLNEIMPYYNKLYESELLEFNPFYDTNLSKEHDGNDDKTHNGTNVNEHDTNTTNSGTIKDNGAVENSDHNVSVLKDVKKDKVTGWEYFSDTPQGTVGNIENLTYLTTAKKSIKDNDITDDSTLTNDNLGTKIATNTQTTDMINHVKGVDTETDNYVDNVITHYTDTIKGKQGSKSYSELLQEFRDTFLNIDMMIIDELSDLFFNLW